MEVRMAQNSASVSVGVSLNVSGNLEDSRLVPASDRPRAEDSARRYARGGLPT